MKKLLLVMMALLIAGFVACSGDSSDKPSNDTASAIFENVFNEVDEAFLAATGESPEGSMMNMAPGDPDRFSEGGDPVTISWENRPDNPTITVEGTQTFSESGDYTYNLTITFINHVCEDGTVISGSTTDIYQVTGSNFSASLEGDLDITYQGTVYDFSWDFTFGFNGTDFTFSGGFTINGEYYPAYLEE